jgi:pimeloyl-ACP methyl ester carboxylesterase
VIALRDGRKVAVEEAGDPDGQPAVWFHGAFSSRLEVCYLDGAARELGVRLIGLNRPGVGGSDPHPGRTDVGYADDVAQVMDHLGIDRAAVGGLSNGGMFTMAVASAMPHRVVRAVPYNPSSPVADPAARAGLSRKGRMSYAYMGRKADSIVERLATRHKPGRIATLLNKLSNPDVRLMDDPAVAAIASRIAAELTAQDVREYLTRELELCMGRWGFDHRAVSVPVTLVSGEKDAGLDYARVWVTELPDARLVVVPGGHGGMPGKVASRRIVEALAGI